MNRREFLAVGGAAGLAVGLGDWARAEVGVAPPLIPEDKGITPEMLAALKKRGERRVYRGLQRFGIGMPCGGIAAGQLYVLGDGTLGGWHVDGRLNNTGWGADNYKMRVQPRELRQGFALIVEGKTKSEDANVFRLADRENDGNVDDIEFVGGYPVAEVRYKTSGPVQVTLRAGAPFIPLNAKDSALPCTLMRFTLTNTSDQVQYGSLIGFLENGIDKGEPGEVPVLRRNRVMSRKGHSTVIMEMLPQPDMKDPQPERVLFDFEGGKYDGWEVKGTAFGSAPSTGTFKKQQKVSGFEGKGLVNSYADDDDLTGEMISAEFVIDRKFMTMLVGGGSHARTCVNLLVDGKIVRSLRGRDDEKLEPRAWDVSEFAGKKAKIQIVDAQKGPWGHINVDGVRLVDVLPEAVKRPGAKSETFGTLAISGPGEGVAQFDMRGGNGESGTWKVESQKGDVAEHDGPTAFAGGITAPFSMGPGESRELVFVVSWCFPNLHTGNGQMYTNWFKDAAEVAAYVYDNQTRLIAETELFRKTWYDDTTLPWWLASRLFMPTANLACGIAQWWKNGRFWCWEGVGSCHGTCTHVYNYAHAEARLFPELSRSTRVMQDLGTGMDEATGRVAFRGEVNGGFEYAADGQSGTILKCYREHLCSPDDSFLKANWEKIKKVIEYQIGRDAMKRGGGTGEPDGIIEVTQHNTFDINFEGPNTFVGSLYLAALKAGAAMADRMGDEATRNRYSEIAAKGAAFTEEKLFENGYFMQIIPKDASTRFQFGKGCMADQLFGQNWARCLDLGGIYSQDKVLSGLKAIYKYNWTPAVGPYSAKYPPERWFAEGREGGMFVCTWPFGGRPQEPVRYRDEVWTGCEYQAAGGMAWEGMVDEALVVVKAIDERYDGTVRNPWNEVECGDHYGRAMASYGVYQALCGFVLDGPAGVIGISPRFGREKFAAFFAGPEGWGLANFAEEKGRRVLTFEVRYGTVRVGRVRVDGIPMNAMPKVVCAGKPVAATHIRVGEGAEVRLGPPMVVKAGEVVEVEVKW